MGPKSRVWGIILGVRGFYFGAILEVWAGCSFQVRFGRRFGRLLGGLRGQHNPYLRPKMGSSGSPDGINIDAKIAQFLDAFEIRLWIGI